MNSTPKIDGNLLTSGTEIFTYDDENELKSVMVTSNWQSQFVYDGKFRRRIERDYVWQSNAWVETNEIHFIYDGNVVIQERDTNNTPLVTYTRGVGGLLARTDGNGPTYYHVDGNRNITLLLDASQNIVAKYLYDPFGNILSQSGPMANANVYRFASKEWNVNAGFYYFGRRYYDPTLQRWLNRDPIGELGGLNVYCFVVNNPINYVDSQGLDFSLWIGGGAGYSNFINDNPTPDDQAKDAREMARAVNLALAMTGENNISSATPLNPVDAAISNGSALTSSPNWTSVYNSHGADSFEETIPSTSYDIKVYLRDPLSNNADTGTISAPTQSLQHYLDYLEYLLGLGNPNLSHAEDLLKQLDAENQLMLNDPIIGVWQCSDSTGDYIRTQIGSPGPNWTLAGTMIQ